VSQVLAGLVYPAAKWQVLMHAESYGADARTRAELWALPTVEYADLTDVLTALLAPEPVVERSAPQVLRHQPPPPGYRRRPAPQAAGRLRPLH
jgi:hypothetical protein